MAGTSATFDQHSGFSSFHISVDGTPLSKDMMKKVEQVIVEQSLDLPDAVTITFRDVGAGTGGDDPLIAAIADGSTFKVGSEISIDLGRDAAPMQVFSGDITALEVDVAPGGNFKYTVRGYDRSHRLQRGRQHRTFQQMTDSDLANKIAGDAGLTPTVDATSVVYDYILQNNQTNLDFLMTRARRIGYECFVSDKKLYFRKPAISEQEVVTVDVHGDTKHLHARLTSTGQVSSVKVHGWDPQQKAPITGEKTSSNSPTSIGGNTTGTSLAQKFGSSTLTVTTRPVISQTEAQNLAQAVLDQQNAAAVVLEGETKGNPKIKPGAKIKVTGLGSTFSGTYYVNSTRHRINHDQTYVTQFTVSGQRPNTLYELTGGSANGISQRGAAAAVAVGVVTNNKDADGYGARVKVKFPWLNDDESTWARLVALGGGSGRGMLWIPEVNDEVLVAFEHGDVHFPVVISGLWNGQDAPPKDGNKSGADKWVSATDGKVNQRVIMSRSGHLISLDDTDGAEQIRIYDKSGKNYVTVDTASNKITVHSQGNLELTAEQDIAIKAVNGKISMNAQQAISTESAQGDISVNAKMGKYDLTAMQNVSVGSTSGNVTANATAGEATLSSAAGTTVSSNASTTIMGPEGVLVSGGTSVNVSAAAISLGA